MAALPGYVEILFSGYGEEFDPSVERTEMERGLPKQRIGNSQVLQRLECTLLFGSKADAAAFETWYFDTIGRIGSFTLDHPRTGASITARLEGGRIGKLVPRNAAFTTSQRAVVFEYLR